MNKINKLICKFGFIARPVSHSVFTTTLSGKNNRKVFQLDTLDPEIRQLLKNSFSALSVVVDPIL